MFNIRRVIIHTAAFDGTNCDVNLIRNWHVNERGWSDIGYHFVCIDDRHSFLKDGTIQKGRSLRRKGAHARGANNRSIGFCFCGHGGKRDFTENQKQAFFDWYCNLVMTLKIDPSDLLVYGHREINLFLPKKYHTTKSCPGDKVDMDDFRRRLSAQYEARTGKYCDMGIV